MRRTAKFRANRGATKAFTPYDHQTLQEVRSAADSKSINLSDIEVSGVGSVESYRELLDDGFCIVQYRAFPSHDCGEKFIVPRAVCGPAANIL